MILVLSFYYSYPLYSQVVKQGCLYRKILDSGKSVQVYMVWSDEIVPLINETGGRGVYILGLFKDEAEVDGVLKSVEQFR